MENNNSMENISPQEYFNTVKERRHKITDEKLLEVYDNCMSLLNKYNITKQYKGMQKLLFHLDCLEKERALVKLGVDTFIYRDDIEEYIDNVAANTVKIIELENYEREIPDEIVKVVEAVSGVFDQLYVVFTDYTGKTERRVERERREKDPILFGTFQSEDAKVIIDRFYYLGDWEDEYCDLTLDKMVNEMKKSGKTGIAHTIKTPEDLKELKEQINSLVASRNNFFVVDESKKKQSFFTKVKSIFKK